MGAVTSTFVAGVEAVKKRLSLLIGSLSQMGRVRLGKRTDNKNPLIRDFVPLASLPDLVFGGWGRGFFVMCGSRKVRVAVVKSRKGLG